MKNKRIEEIKSKLINLGTENDVMYTNDEKLKRLIMLQSAMSNSVFEMSHAGHFASKDIMKHFEVLAEEYNLSSTREFHRLSDNMDHLSHTIAILKSGQKAEKETQKMFRLIELDKNVETLYNIGLCSGSDQTEIDTIIISPYGLFLIEIKNFNQDMRLTDKGVFETVDSHEAYYNLGVKMLLKEYLIRKVLSDDISIPIIPILLFSNDKSSLIDDYGQCHISYSGTIVNDIRSYFCYEEILSLETIQSIKETLLENHTPTTGLCNVNCGQIVDDFALLMAEIEEAADNTNNNNETIEDSPKNVDTVSKEKKLEWKDYIYNYLDIIIPSCMAGISAYYLLSRKG